MTKISMFSSFTLNIQETFNYTEPKAYIFKINLLARREDINAPPTPRTGILVHLYMLTNPSCWKSMKCWISKLSASFYSNHKHLDALAKKC